MSIRNLLIIFLVLLLTSCSKEQLSVDDSKVVDDKKMATQNKAVELMLNKSIQWQDLTIEFMQLNDDSRCPKGTECFWAGNAQAVFLVTSKTVAQTVSLNTHGGDEYPQSAMVDGYEINLKKLSPYPATNIKIDPSQYTALLEIKEKVEANASKVVIDVRTEKEFKAGHYPNAKNLNYEAIESTIDSLNLAKDTEIYVYCRSGRRSGIAQEILQKKGYTNVTNGINQDAMHKRFNTASKM